VRPRPPPPGHSSVRHALRASPSSRATSRSDAAARQHVSCAGVSHRVCRLLLPPACRRHHPHSPKVVACVGGVNGYPPAASHPSAAPKLRLRPSGSPAWVGCAAAAWSASPHPGWWAATRGVAAAGARHCPRDPSLAPSPAAERTCAAAEHGPFGCAGSCLRAPLLRAGPSAAKGWRRHPQRSQPAWLQGLRGC
jgi:hypothetical protein